MRRGCQMAGDVDVSSLTFVVTARCNLTCTYCYQNAKTHRGMSWRVMKPWLDRAAATRNASVDILFTGGEPLLDFPLVRRAVRYIEQRCSRRPTIQFHLLTNGTLLAPGVTDFLAAHDFEVQVSLDGVPEAQRLRGPATVARLDGVLTDLAARRAEWFARRVSAGMTLVARTIPTLAASVEYLLSKGVARIAINPALTRQDGWSADARAELERQLRRVCQLSAARYRATGTIPVELLRRRPRRLPRGKSGWLCAPFRGDQITVDVDGDVSGCVMFAASSQRFPSTPLGCALGALRLGRADVPGFRSRLAVYRSTMQATGLFDRAEEKRSSYGRCGSCRYGGECRICPVAIGYQSSDDPNRVPDFLCAFYRAATRSRRRFLAMTQSAAARRRAA